jgi:hypothetical protein
VVFFQHLNIRIFGEAVFAGAREVCRFPARTVEILFDLRSHFGGKSVVPIKAVVSVGQSPRPGCVHCLRAVCRCGATSDGTKCGGGFVIVISYLVVWRRSRSARVGFAGRSNAGRLHQAISGSSQEQAPKIWAMEVNLRPLCTLPSQRRSQVPNHSALVRSAWSSCHI